MSNRRAVRIVAAVVPALACALLVQACSASPAQTAARPHQPPAPPTLYIYASQAGSGEDVVTPVNTATNTPGTPIHVSEAGGPSFPGGMIVITPDGKTVYVTRAANRTSGTSAIIPINTATGTPGMPIRVAGDQSLPVIAVAPDGKTAYVMVAPSRTVTRINTVTGRPGRPIRLGSPGGCSGDQIAITPDGKTVYVTRAENRTCGTSAIIPINTATGTPGKPVHIAGHLQIAITPDGKTAYVTTESGSPVDYPVHDTATVTPINTATNTPGKPIDIGVAKVSYGIAITPDGKTAYVSTENGCQGPGPCGLTVTPIRTATNTPGTPIHVGFGPLGDYCTGQIAITPDGKTAYVTTGLGLTPINTATGTAGKPIKVGASPPDSCRQIVFTPDGKTAYVTTGPGVTPINTATGTLGKPIDVGALGTYAEAIAITP